MPSAAPDDRQAGAKANYDYLVVGAGFAGSVLAERLASQHDAQRAGRSTGGRMSAAMPMTGSTRRAC